MTLWSQQLTERQKYVAHCPTCGNGLDFSTVTRVVQMESVSARCSTCGHVWSMIFDLDKSGTFGVQSFQCDNEDRQMDCAQCLGTGSVEGKVFARVKCAVCNGTGIK